MEKLHLPKMNAAANFDKGREFRVQASKILKEQHRRKVCKKLTVLLRKLLNLLTTNQKQENTFLNQYSNHNFKVVDHSRENL